MQAQRRQEMSGEAAPKPMIRLDGSNARGVVGIAVILVLMVVLTILIALAIYGDARTVSMHSGNPQRHIHAP